MAPDMRVFIESRNFFVTQRASWAGSSFIGKKGAPETIPFFFPTFMPDNRRP